MSEQNPSSLASELPIGAQVNVRDGNPRPPERFKRKLASWEHNNYEGVVVQAEGNGRYTVQRKPADGWTTKHYILKAFMAGVPAAQIQRVDGTSLLPVVDDGFHAEVDTDAIQSEAEKAA